MNFAGSFSNDGTFNHSNGTIVFNGTSSINGNSTTNFFNISITGTLTAPTTLNVAGNFSNSGTFTAGAGTVLFNGSAQQDINGSATTTFNNITVSNSGAGVRVQSNQSLRGILTLAGTSQFDADGSSETAVFTLLSTADSPISDASIAAIPAGAAVNGNVTVQRYMAIEGTNSRMYRYISSPVSSTPVSQIQTEIPVTGGFTGASTCAGCGTK